MLESSWFAKDSFVLVFQRPDSLKAPDRDPDALSSIPLDTVKELLPAAGKSYQRVAFVALGQGRKLIAPLLAAAPAKAVDIVLEEWATQKDERPAGPAGVDLPSVLTKQGDPGLGPEPLDAVFFLDTYHLLFHGPALLAHLRDRLANGGRVFILDRASQRELSHREASHRRMVSTALVEREMRKAGFTLLKTCPPPTGDRFLLVFGKTPASQPDKAK